MDFTLMIPDETLSYIFSHVQSIEPGARKALRGFQRNHVHPSREAILGWIKVSFVSRRWRQVAIQNATLWTHLNAELGSNWVDEFIRRSKDAVLTLDGQYFPHIGENARDMRLRQLVSTYHGRLADLRVTVPIGPAILDELLSYTFKSLVELNLKTANYGVNGSVSLRSLFERTPRLRRLTIDLADVSCATFNWQAACFSALTHLDLVFGSNPATLGAMAISPQLLDALRRMTALTHLAIYESLPTAPLNCNHRCSGTSADLILFQSMRSMVVESCHETHAHILRHVRLPSRARLNLGSHSLSRPDPPKESPTYEALSKELEAFLRAYTEAPLFQSAYLSFDLSNFHDIDPVGPGSTFVTLGLTRAAQPARPEFVNLIYGTAHDPHDRHVNDLSIRVHASRASDIVSLLPHDSVRFLTLYNAALSYDHALLSLFPNVERLCLSTWMPVYGIHLLGNTSVLPNLRLIDLYGKDSKLLNILRSFDNSEPSLSVTDTQFLVLENVLRARGQMGSPLRAVYLHIAEEVALVRAGKIAETSCRRDVEATVLEAIQRLEDKEEVQFVQEDFNVFGSVL
ncbi:hypothetical protein PENSPDRAFT_656794 [Peniophora sp. CONT]|nr:hypothetical protein PENSPDRAFT_656794 [Peniophora sp. CONT]